MELHASHTENLSRLSLEDGVHFLLQQIHQISSPSLTEKQAAYDITRALGGQALALRQVAAYLSATNCSLQACCQQLLEQQKPEVANKAYQALDLSNTLVLAHLERMCPRAVEIARMCAFLAPEYIPAGLFIMDTSVQEPDPALEHLFAFAILTPQQTTMTLSMLPLLRDVWRDTCGLVEREQLLEQVARIFYKYLRLEEAMSAGMLPQYLAHIQQLAQYGELRTFTNLETAALFFWGASVFYKQEAYAEAEPLFQYAQFIRLRKLGEKHRSVITGTHLLGVVKARLRKYDESYDLLYQATSLRSQLLGATHAETLESFTELAAVLYAMGRSREAASTYQQAIALIEQEQGPDSPALLPLLERLVELLITVANFSEAERWLQRAYASAESNKEFDLQKKQEILHQLALVSMALENWTQAEVLFQRLASSWQTVQEQEQPVALAVQRQLVLALIAQGKLEQAEAISLHILPIQQRVLGPMNQETIQCQEQLAFLYAYQGRLPEFQGLTQHTQLLRNIQAEAADPSEAIIGLIGQAGMAIGQQDFGQAESLLQQAFDLCLLVPGGDDLAQATILHALAIAQAGLKHYAQAVAALQQTLTIRERLLGPEHFDTQSAQEQYRQVSALIQPEFPGFFPGFEEG